MFIISRFKAHMLQMKVHVIHFQSMHWTATQPLTNALLSMPCSESPKPSVVAILVPGRKIPITPALALPLPSPLMRRLNHPMAPPPAMHRRPNKPSKRARENPARTSPCSPARPTRSWPRTKPTTATNTVADSCYDNEGGGATQLGAPVAAGDVESAHCGIAPLQRALAAHPAFLRSRCIAKPMHVVAAGAGETQQQT